MKFEYIVTLVIAVFCFANVHGQVTYLDYLVPQYHRLWKAYFKFVGAGKESSYDWNLKRGKTQNPIPDSQQFFCDPDGPGKRSDSIPNSVHQLRPGDIDIIGAMGDSLTAGNGGLATNILHMYIESRGIVGTIGGQATWHKYLTLPNILKVFNPKLYGYSLSDGYSVERISRFNVGEPRAMSRDIPHQAEIIIKRMTADPLVNIKEHWKLITILIGANDFCSEFCYTKNPEKSIKKHEKDLVTGLRILRDNLPRTMVNLVTPPNMQLILGQREKPFECESLHHFECFCFIGFAYKDKLQRYLDIIERWREVVSTVSNMKEFNREDFTVNNQPFLINATMPTLPNGNSDYTYMSFDCFHLSQKGYARAANALWNNMMEPEGHKSTDWNKEFTKFICPTEERPFIATKKNS